MRNIRRWGLGASSAVFCVSLAAPVAAQTRAFDVPSQPVASAIRQLGNQADIQIIAARRVTQGKVAKAVHGTFTVEQALVVMLSGTGLVAQATGPQTFTLVTAMGEDHAGSAAAEDGSAEIVVTGSRIAGAPSASPVISISQKQFRDAGQHDLGEVIRSVPQNFSGGQNPGVQRGVGGVANQNLTGGSALNLRGLGPDATLTLLNGRRLSYDAFSQVVDISAIPLAAVDRLEIVPDGASAIYGSEAVAGVANIILKRDYDGLTTSARLGGATDGGYFQQQYDAVGGATWSSGGMIATAHLDRYDGLYARQRSYSDYLEEPYTLLPRQRGFSAVLSGHQAIASVATLSIDALYTDRNSNQALTYFGTNAFTDSDSSSFMISPSLKLSLPKKWAIELSGSYGQSRATLNNATVSGGSTSVERYCYCNIVRTVEASASGPLFALPGGDLQIVVGGGFRSNSLRVRFYAGGTDSNPGTRSSYYAFAEASAPLVSGAQDIPWIDALMITAAVRREKYREFAAVTTPKLGLVYAPTRGVTLKGSWGKSFKTPTLTQQFGPTDLYLYPAALVGAVGAPADAAVLVPFGSNRSLTPERATTWTATMILEPHQVQGLHIEASYFDINYTGRVVLPVDIQSALSNPVFSPFVTLAPSPAQQQATIGSVAHPMMNFTGVAYDPSTVLAIISDLYVNATRQRVSGIDASGSYRFRTSSGTLALSAQASWLTSRQRTVPLAAATALAGTAFNPPRFRGRAGLSWDTRPISLSGYVNYIGGVINTQLPSRPQGNGMATVDFALSYRIPAQAGVFKGVELDFSLQNLLNQAPPRMDTSAPYYVSYDSTNYSALGRTVSLTLSKRW